MDTEIFEKNVPGSTEQFQKHAIGIAGCGGLGSNAAVALTRAGIGKLVLVDFDRVEKSNLNRQYYFRSDIGQLKVDALADHLRAINPELKIEVINRKISSSNLADLFHNCSILIEAFDKAESKQFLIDTWCKNFPDRPIVCGNGLAGLGDTESIKVRKSGNIFMCGDSKTDSASGLCSARVAIVANMQANVALELLFKR